MGSLYFYGIALSEKNNAVVLVLANAFIILYEEFPGAGHGEDGLPVCQVFGDLEGISDAAGNRSVFFAHGVLRGDVLLL